MKSWLGAIWKMVTTLNPAVALTSSVFTVAWAFMSLAFDLWDIVVIKVAQLVLPPSAVVTMTGALSFINYIFPLQELFVFVMAYLPLLTACAAIRIIKSFIPTIS